MKETDIQRQILDFLKFCKVFAWRNNTRTVWVAGRPIKYGIIGGGDIIGVLPGGRFLSIEVKSPKGQTAKKRAEAQEKFRDAINGAGGLAIVARSVEEVAEELKKAGPFKKPAMKF